MEEAIFRRKPTRAEIVTLAVGIGIRLAIPCLLPYWRLFAFVGVMYAFVWMEFKRTRK